MFKLDLEMTEEPETKLPTSTGSSKKAREFKTNIYVLESFINKFLVVYLSFFFF